MQARKSRGSAAVLAYRGHLLTENRNGLVVSTRTTQAYGAAERDAALLMVEDIPGNGCVTLGADKGYDVHDFIGELRHNEHNEIAEMMGCSIGNISRSFTKARVKLRGALNITRAENGRLKNK